MQNMYQLGCDLYKQSQIPAAGPRLQRPTGPGAATGAQNLMQPLRLPPQQNLMQPLQASPQQNLMQPFTPAQRQTLTPPMPPAPKPVPWMQETSPVKASRYKQAQEPGQTAFEPPPHDIEEIMQRLNAVRAANPDHPDLTNLFPDNAVGRFMLRRMLSALGPPEPPSGRIHSNSTSNVYLDTAHRGNPSVIDNNRSMLLSYPEDNGHPQTAVRVLPRHSPQHNPYSDAAAPTDSPDIATLLGSTLGASALGGGAGAGIGGLLGATKSAPGAGAVHGGLLGAGLAGGAALGGGLGQMHGGGLGALVGTVAGAGLGGIAGHYAGKKLTSKKPKEISEEDEEKKAYISQLLKKPFFKLGYSLYKSGQEAIPGAVAGAALRAGHQIGSYLGR